MSTNYLWLNFFYIDMITKVIFSMWFFFAKNRIIYIPRLVVTNIFPSVNCVLENNVVAKLLRDIQQVGVRILIT